MAARTWLVKTEAQEYGFDDLLRDGRGRWDGVRSYAARGHLRAMRAGDEVLVYHSGRSREVVGLARVVRAAYPDPTAESGDWSAVDLEPLRPLARPIPLSELRADAKLAGFVLLRQSRLSVMPVTAAERRRILRLEKQPELENPRPRR